MNKIITTLTLLVMTFTAVQAQKGLYIQPTIGVLVTSETPYPAGGLSLGYAFGKNKVGVYNQIGTDYIKLGTLEFQRDFGTKKSALVSLVGFTVFNSYYEGGGVNRNKSSNGNQSIDLGLGYKRLIRGNWSALATIRVSAFQGVDHQTNIERTVTPVTMSIGVSKF